MRNRFIRSAWMIVLGMGVCMVVPVQATFTVLDVFRGTQLTLQSIERASQYAANLSKNNALEKQIQIWTAKTEITPPKASTYEYALKNDSTTLPSSEVAPPQKSLDEAVAFVQKTFFLPANTAEATEEMKAEIVNKRKAYVTHLGKEIISYASGIRTSTADDLKSLEESSSAAGGILQEIELNTETIKSLVLITAANIFLEARVMEMEAAGMLLGQEEQLLEQPQGG